MPVNILMPKLGLTMTEGQIVEWKKGEGDPVKAGEVLFVLETEKVAYEVEAPEDGVLGRILAADGDTVPVGSVVAYLLKPGEKMEDLPDAAPQPATADEKPAAAPVADPHTESSPPASGERVRATPLARKLARDLGVPLATVSATGPTGRVVADDVRKAAAAPRPQTSSAPAGEAAAERLVPLSGMRRTIARNMMASKVETAQTYMSLSADATALVQCRRNLLPFVEEKYGVRLTLTDLMMKVTGAAILEHPVINTRWTDQGILYLPSVHMGMAMALDDGLIVPVIRDINGKGLGRIAKDRTEVIQRCREKKFLPDDIKGSTFTLSSLGMFGIETFTANINGSESAILAVGAAVEKPVVVVGEIVVRPMMGVTLTYDHRIIDGAEAAKFMQTLKGMIEAPERLLV